MLLEFDNIHHDVVGHMTIFGLQVLRRDLPLLSRREVRGQENVVWAVPTVFHVCIGVHLSERVDDMLGPGHREMDDTRLCSDDRSTTMVVVVVWWLLSLKSAQF